MWWSIDLSLLTRFAARPLDEDEAACLEAFRLLEVVAKEHMAASNAAAVLSVVMLFEYDETASAAVHSTGVIEQLPLACP